MAILKIIREGLRSQVVREAIGERRLDIFEALTTSGDDGNGGGGLLGLGRRLVGFLTNVVGQAARWLLSNAWDIFVEASFEIATFDWNQTDASIRESIDANWVQLAGSFGDLFGTGLVWTVSIGLSAAAAVKFPVLGGQIAQVIAEEGGEELRGALRGFLTQSRDVLTRNLILGGFLTARRLRLFGLAPVTEQREPWTIAGEIEERIESIDNRYIRAFVENFVESAVDAVIEVGYVVSYAIDDYYSTNRRAINNAFGEQRAVILTPDRRSEDENVILRGPQTLIQQNIQTALVSHQLVHNRDIGQIVGQPAGDWLRAGVQRRVLTITYRNKELPPWTLPNGERIKEITVTIPDCRVGLNWRDIKAVCRPWTWGKFRATANLDNGRKLKVNGSSPVEAEQTLRRFATLQTAEILTLSVTEEKDRHPDLIKRPEQVWPSYGHLLVRRRVSGDSGLTELNGQNYQNDRIRFELWPNEEPEGLPLLT